MDEASAETLGLVLEQTRRFVRRSVNSDQIEGLARIPTAVIEAAAEAGLFGLTIGEEHGGLGLPLGSACEVVRTIAETDRSVAVMVGLHTGLGTRGLVAHGTDAARNRWLPALARGERIASFAATEPGAGSDLTSLQTTARMDGEALCVDGEKAYVTNGGFAGLFTVLAAAPGIGGRHGSVVVALPAESPGITVGPEEHKLGIRASSTVSLHFEGVRAAMDQVVGTPGRGHDVAYDVLTWGRTLMAAGCVGTAAGALAATVDHVSNRRQFGRALGAFGAVRETIADMSAKVYAMEAMVQHAGSVATIAGALETASLAAKVYCSEANFAVCDASVQLHGALGFIETVGVARRLRDCRITRIFEGANDVLLIRHGTGMVTAPQGKSPEVFSTRVVDTAFDTAVAACRELAGAIASGVTAARKTYGLGVVRQQLVLARLARADVCLRAGLASVERAVMDARGDARALGAYAAEALAAEGMGHVSAAARGADDDVRASALCTRLYPTMGAARTNDSAARRSARGEGIRP